MRSRCGIREALPAWSLVLSTLLLGAPAWRSAVAQELPDAPSALLAAANDGIDTGQTAGQATDKSGGVAGEVQQAAKSDRKLPLCPPAAKPASDEKNAASAASGASESDTLGASETTGAPCRNEAQIQPVVTSGHATPLTMSGKAVLAARDIIDPFNLLTIIGYSGIAVAANAHSAYGPGFPGFGRLAGYSLVEDMQGEFFGTFLIPTLVHQDPRYHRMPDQKLPKRILHAVGHTFVSHHDDGTPMLNCATLLTYPISAELSNLYVPGVATDGASTARRIGIGIATDPAGTLVAEFLPDLAKRIHIHIIFVQQILNQVVVGAPITQ